jgi:hypothetical protein
MLRNAAELGTFVQRRKSVAVSISNADRKLKRILFQTGGRGWLRVKNRRRQNQNAPEPKAILTD